MHPLGPVPPSDYIFQPASMFKLTFKDEAPTLPTSTHSFISAGCAAISLYLCTMPPSKLKPSEVAAEAKKTYIPYIRQHCSEDWPPTSYLCHSDSIVASRPLPQDALHCRFAFYERDPVDLALDWCEPGAKDRYKIPVIMPANEKRPGGDWEAGVMAPEECLCRRSNLYATLTTPAANNSSPTNYPIPPIAGIYSGQVVVFRGGPEKYEQWPEMRSLPIISVPPVKRPKLDNTGKKYSFKAEKELMRDKMRTALRIAVYYGHTKLVIGTFGLGAGFRNPTEEVAIMWRDLLIREPEFNQNFEDVVFSFDAPEGPSSSSSKSGSSSSKSKGSSSSSKTSVTEDLNIFRHIFSPAVVHNAFKTPIQQHVLSPSTSYSSYWLSLRSCYSTKRAASGCWIMFKSKQGVGDGICKARLSFEEFCNWCVMGVTWEWAQVVRQGVLVLPLCWKDR